MMGTSFGREALDQHLTEYREEVWCEGTCPRQNTVHASAVRASKESISLLLNTTDDLFSVFVEPWPDDSLLKLDRPDSSIIVVAWAIAT
jgi:hypothetical protein